MSSDVSFITAERAQRRKTLMTYAVATLMTMTAAFSYLYFRSQTPVEAITFSPVSDSQSSTDEAEPEHPTSTGQPGQEATQKKPEGITLEEIEKEEAKKKQASPSKKWHPQQRRSSGSQDAPRPSVNTPQPSEPVESEVDFDPLARRR